MDYIVKERLFNVYLLTGHTRHRQAALVARMRFDTAGGNNWPRPIPVWGYDDTLPRRGRPVRGRDGLQPGSTTWVRSRPAAREQPCVLFHGPPGRANRPMEKRPSPGASEMALAAKGADASSGAPPRRRRSNSAGMRHILVLVSSSSSSSSVRPVAHVRGGDHRRRRQAEIQPSSRARGETGCSSAATGALWGRGRDDPSLDCFPLVWSLSPRLATAAPGMLQWYYEQAQANRGPDSFALPPSGHLYAYPGMMPDEAQAAFAERTERRRCRTLDTSAVVH